MDASDLTGPERRIWEAFTRGAAVDLGGDDPTGLDATAEDGKPDQCVRAEVIARLLLGAVAAEPGYPPRLTLTGARITGAIDLSSGEVGCELRLTRCWLDDQFDASDTKTRSVTLHACRVPRVDLWEIDVDGSLRLTACRIGELNLGSAHVGGRLHLSGSILTNPGQRALTGTRLAVDHSMICRGTRATGEIRLIDATIGTALILTGVTLDNPGGAALNAAGLTTEQTVYCDQDFTATGEVVFRRARIHGQLLLEGTIKGVLDLRSAQVQSLALPSYPPATRLDGSSYGGLYPHQPAPARIGWLRSDPEGYRAQPYEQLAGHYRHLGDDHQARRVLLAKRRARRATLPVPRRLGGWLLDGMSGYGYAPGRAFGWLVAAWTVGAGYFAVHPPAGEGRFHPIVYALDLLLPTSPLGIAQGFSAQAAGFWLAAGMQVLGWTLSIAVLPALTRALSRN